MEGVLKAVQAVLSVLVMMGLGMLLTKFKWLDAHVAGFVSKFVVKVALPATIVYNMMTQYTRASLMGMAAGLIAPFIGLIIGMLAGAFIARLIHMERNRRGGFVVAFSFSNSVFIGLPVCAALFGEAANGYALIYYISNTVLFWTVGHAMMAQDGNAAHEERSYRLLLKYWLAKDKSAPELIPAANASGFLAKLMPLPLVFLLMSVVMLLADIQLPPFLLDSTKYIGNTVTSMSLLYIGYNLMNMITKREFSWKRGYGWIILGKFIFMPLIVMAFIWLIGLIPAIGAQMTDTLKGALIIQAAMPVMSQSAIVESNCGGDSEYMAGATALTTVCSFGFIPFYMWIIGLIM